MAPFRSKEQIKCGHCQVSMRRDRLAEHTREFHPGQSKKEDGEKNQNLLDMFARKTSANRPTQETAMGTSKRSGADTETDDDGPSSSKRPKFAPESTEFDSTMPIQIPEEPQTESGKDVTGTVKDANNKTQKDTEKESEKEDENESGKNLKKETEKESIEEKLDSILAALSGLKLDCQQATFSHQQSGHEKDDTESFANKGAETDVEALKVLIKNCKSVRRLCDLATLSIFEDGLTCDACSPLEETLPRPQVYYGVFGYDFSLGTDFSTENQPMAFSNLKKSVARHVTTKNHLKNLREHEEDKERLRKLQAKDLRVGMTVGRQAYRILKYGRPFADFEVDMLLLSSAKVNVGNLNHSRKFVSNLRPAFAEAVNQRVRAFLQQPLESMSCIPPVGIVTDNVTSKRRTGQMYAAVLFTPGMPNLLTPISLGVTPNKKHDGLSIADEICEVCTTYGILSRQLAGFGFDGQYFHLKVDSKLKEKLKLDDTVGFMWDPAHLLQLADKDTRKKIDWTDEISKDIAAVLNKFSFGKTFESALDKAHLLGVDLKAPLWFSETRFAAFAYTVFQNFVDNYKVIRSVLEDIAATDDQRANEACSLLRRIRKLDFIGKLLLCVDYYRVLDELVKCEFASFSLFTSDVGVTTPFRRTRQQDVQDLDASRVTPALAVYDTAINRVDSLKKLGNAIAEQMLGNMKNRFPNSYFKDIANKRKAASLLPILERAHDLANESSKVEFLQTSEVQTLQEQHPKQVEGVRNLCLNIFRQRADLQLKDIDTDIKLYHRVFTARNLYIGAEHILASIAKIFCSCPPELVVESMGSVIEKIRGVRGGTKSSTNKRDIDDISQELVIHWNGPHISHCDAVVRQALNIHFKGAAWHFVAMDVRSRLHRVSQVVDRLNRTQPDLTFMTQ
ncbi:hypothetical protein HOLleu_15484 [Holothuria leucospilota]|uniref:Uncharacterized protein n=1 Tax=Holothuria leucospilota TaxID=206669 RepID=A0A9Q1C950_HOLLE|nr:hypothetical protein HOLleu_15484 [Holothuria leucospilota]